MLGQVNMLDEQYLAVGEVQTSLRAAQVLNGLWMGIWRNCMGRGCVWAVVAFRDHFCSERANFPVPNSCFLFKMMVTDFLSIRPFPYKPHIFRNRSTSRDARTAGCRTTETPSSTSRSTAPSARPSSELFFRRMTAPSLGRISVC